MGCEIRTSRGGEELLPGGGALGGAPGAPRGGKHKDSHREPRRRGRATYNRYGGVRRGFAAPDLAKGELHGHSKPFKRRTQALVLPVSPQPVPARGPDRRVSEEFSPHLTTKKCQRLGTRAAANNAEVAHTPTNSSWPHRIEAQLKPCATSPLTAPTTLTTMRRAA